MALMKTVATIVFCRPTLSARNPIKIREMAFTPFERAMNTTPVFSEYDNDAANKEV